MNGRKCPGLHCRGCKDNGGAGLVALVAAVAIVSAALRAIWHTLITIAEIAAYTALAIVGLAVVAGGIYAAVRVRRYILDRRARRPVSVRAEVVPFAAVAPERPAIDPPRQRADGWPLPSWWEEVRPQLGRDGP